MKTSTRSPRVKVTADGGGVVSHAGSVLLRETATLTGLVAAVDDVLIGTYAGVPFHAPGQVFADLAVAVADGADCVSGIGVLGDREELFGKVPSMPTTWRVLHRINAKHLDAVAAARGVARERAWAAGAGPDLSKELHLDFDATITIAHSEKEKAGPTFKKTFGYHPLLCFLDRPEIAGGEGLAGLLRPGNAGSNTAADHIKVLGLALANLPVHARPIVDDPSSQRVLARSDSAGATHDFAKECRRVGVGFSFGFPVTKGIQAIVGTLGAHCWEPAVEADGTVRDGAWVTEITALANLSEWPEHSRLILRKERPHPGAQLTFTDVDGHRITAVLTDTQSPDAPGEAAFGIAGLELRHRQHARVEDRIRQAKASGLRSFPCHGFAENSAWLQVVLAANDLVCWAKLIAFPDVPTIARAEIAAFRYAILHVAARLASHSRAVHLRIDKTWKWATHIAEGFARLRAAFP